MSFWGKAGWLHPSLRHHSTISFGQNYQDDNREKNKLTRVVNKAVAERNLWAAPLQLGETVFSTEEGREYSLPENAKEQAEAIEEASKTLCKLNGIIALHERKGQYVVVAAYYDSILGSREVRIPVEPPLRQKPSIPQLREYAHA